MRFGCVFEVVDGERGDDRIVVPGLGGLRVVRELEDGLLVAAESLPGLREHGCGVVDQVEACVGEALANKGGEQAGAGAEVENMIRGLGQ